METPFKLQEATAVSFSAGGAEYPVREGHPADTLVARAEGFAEEARKELERIRNENQTGAVSREQYRQEMFAAKDLAFAEELAKLAALYAEAVDDPTRAEAAERMKEKLKRIFDL